MQLLLFPDETNAVISFLYSRQKSQVKGQLANVFITGSYVAYYDKHCDDIKEAFRSLLFFLD